MKFPNPVKLLRTVFIALYAKYCGYETVASARTRKKRFKKCDKCIYNPDGFQCEACSCLLDAKIALNTESCPKGHWGRVWEKKHRKK